MTEIRPKARPRVSAGIPSCRRHFALRLRRLRDRECLQEALPHASLALGIELSEVGEVEREALVRTTAQLQANDLAAELTISCSGILEESDHVSFAT